MNINHMHISHFDVEINKNVVPSDRLVQLTGPWSSLLRLVAYFGLERIPSSFRDNSFILVDVSGSGIGHLHQMDTGNQLAFDREWFESKSR